MDLKFLYQRLRNKEASYYIDVFFVAILLTIASTTVIFNVLKLEMKSQKEVIALEDQKAEEYQKITAAVQESENYLKSKVNVLDVKNGSGVIQTVNHVQRFQALTGTLAEVYALLVIYTDVNVNNKNPKAPKTINYFLRLQKIDQDIADTATELNDAFSPLTITNSNEKDKIEATNAIFKNNILDEDYKELLDIYKEMSDYLKPILKQSDK